MGKKAWIVAILLIGIVAYTVIAGLEREKSHIEVLSYDDSDYSSEGLAISEEMTDDPSDWDFDDFDSASEFFVEYRMERERVRAQELETLNEMIDNYKVGEEARKNAEKQILNLTEKMEEELIVENMIKAQGYKDVILFSSNGAATIMVYTDNFEDEDFLLIAESVSNIMSIAREEVQVIQHR